MINSIKIIHNLECNFWQNTKADLEVLLKKIGINISIEEVVIKNDEQARNCRFFGSPQVMINNEDIDPLAKRMTNFHVSGCRPYFYKEKSTDFPLPEMLEEAIKKYM